MSVPQNFRSAFNGFHREDVARYLEYLQNKYQSEIQQLTAENEELRQRLEEQEDVRLLQEKCGQLEEEVADLQNQLSAREEMVPEIPQAEAVLSASETEELAAYRRAERIEREARERSELVYFQANGVLTEAASRVDGIAGQITDLADQVMSQLTQLQVAVSASKQALQDASSIMGAIKPNRE